MEHEILIYNTESDYAKNICCYTEDINCSLKDAVKTAKELLKKFDAYTYDINFSIVNGKVTVKSKIYDINSFSEIVAHFVWHSENESSSFYFMENGDFFIKFSEVEEVYGVFNTGTTAYKIGKYQKMMKDTFPNYQHDFIELMPIIGRYIRFYDIDLFLKFIEAMNKIGAKPWFKTFVNICSESLGLNHDLIYEIVSSIFLKKYDLYDL